MDRKVIFIAGNMFVLQEKSCTFFFTFTTKYLFKCSHLAFTLKTNRQIILWITNNFVVLSEEYSLQIYHKIVVFLIKFNLLTRDKMHTRSLITKKKPCVLFYAKFQTIQKGKVNCVCSTYFIEQINLNKIEMKEFTKHLFCV